MVLIVDSKLIAYNIGYSKDRSMVDVFEIVFNIAQQLEAEKQKRVKRIIFAFDFGKSDYRKTLWPHYKGGRNYSVMAEDFQTNYRELLPQLAAAIGIDVLGVEGVEADDLAGILISASSKSADIVCVTADRDWLQLGIENPHVSIFDPKQYKFLGSSCSSVAQFLVEKAIKGDTSDNIFGIYNCGDVNYCKFADAVFSNAKSYTGPFQQQLDFLNKEFIKFANSSPKFDIHQKYKDNGIITFEDLFHFNIKLGAIMTDQSLLTDTQKADFVNCAKAFKQNNLKSIAEIQSLAQKISGKRVGLFGDPLTIPTYQLEFYSKLKFNG